MSFPTDRRVTGAARTLLLVVLERVHLVDARSARSGEH
jgi:hypothetical protein